MNKPAFIQSKIIKKEYDGISNDLFTGGLGCQGLCNAQEPLYQNLENPTEDEIRTSTIYHNYRSLLDTSPGGGFGKYFSLVSNQSKDCKIAGKEFYAFAHDNKVTLIVQIPETFDPEKPRILAAPSSGSRGIYGAVGPVGEWGLTNNFAIVYTDKGTGIGIHDLESNEINTITGNRKDANKAGNDSNFTVKMTDEERFEFNKKFPHRLAFKHAHSQENPEALWGTYVLEAIQFAFYILNLEENFGKKDSNGGLVHTIKPENTMVIASGISNGGVAALRAGEEDIDGLIDAIVVSEPNITPETDETLSIRHKDKIWTSKQHSKPMADYHSLILLYQPCACLHPEIKAKAPFNCLPEELCINRCKDLFSLGLLKSKTTEEQAIEAQQIINDYGILEEQNILQPSHFTFGVSEAILTTYTTSYGKFHVKDNLCGVSFAQVDENGKPVPFNKILANSFYAKSNGLPPSLGVEIINNNSKNGPVNSKLSLSKSGHQDLNLEAVLCFRNLITGKDIFGNELKGHQLEKHKKISKGISEIKATGNLRGKPTIIVHGRSDAVVSPNHTSRPYFGVNKKLEKTSSKLHYYEVTNAHHLDLFNAFDGLNSRFINLQYYLKKSLDLMKNHLEKNIPLPPSQVIKTSPRQIKQEKLLDVDYSNLPDIVSDPGDNEIEFKNGEVVICSRK